jgi:hypothetical protein
VFVCALSADKRRGSRCIAGVNVSRWSKRGLRKNREALGLEKRLGRGTFNATIPYIAEVVVVEYESPLSFHVS